MTVFCTYAGEYVQESPFLHILRILMYTNPPFLHMRKASSIENLHDLLMTLTPGRYVGIEDEEDDGIPFEEKMKKLTRELSKSFSKSQELEDKIIQSLLTLGFNLDRE